MFNFQKRGQPNPRIQAQITQAQRIQAQRMQVQRMQVQRIEAQRIEAQRIEEQTNPRIQRQMYAQLIYQNQNRLPVEHKIQKRIIMPTNNLIDLHNNINSNVNYNKTIVHVLDNSNGFGDFLRGSILLAQYAKYFNINFKMDVSRHAISKCLTNETEVLFANAKIHLITYHTTNESKSHINLYSIIEQFINSNEENLYITTNLFYNKDIVSQDIKDYINSFLKFKQQYYNIVENLFNLKKYNVVHIRCLDTNFNTDFGNDTYLFSEIIKLQLTPDTIIISNNYGLKIKLNKLFGFHFIDKHTYHSGKINDYTELETTIIEYIILSNSSHTNCFSYYHHGSGFSEQCSVLNNIPYSVIFLPNKNIGTNNIKLLINHYTNLVENNFITNVEINKEKVNDNKDYNNISFITLTNSGYIDYTLNCLQSLKNINMTKELKVYCIGEKGYSILKNNGVLCELIDNDNDNDTSNFQKFRTKQWSNVTYYKFEIIYNNLLKNEYVCITDGDIVYENNQIFDYLK
jgi:hypothetical protein